MSGQLPVLLFTLGDVAGIGPEIVVKAWHQLLSFCTPVVIGDHGWLDQASRQFQPGLAISSIQEIDQARPSVDLIPCLSVSSVDLRGVVPCQVSGAAGRAAFDFLCEAIRLTMERRASGIVTAPIHKEGLRAAGLHYPGHTEILAEKTGVHQFGMVLAVPGLAVAHVTLHMALRDVFANLTEEGIVNKAELLHDLLTRILKRTPRIAVAALNPHASDGGLFGEEEEKLISPAVARIRKLGMNIQGPIPCDTLFVRARGGEFDGVVAMYHDQGHIALKLFGVGKAVNISVGLPIVRTSVAHGTAYDIAWQGKADPASLVEAARIATQLA